MDSLQYEVEQCTGFLDRDHKCIYEGDILAYKEQLWCIKWDDGNLKFYFKGINTFNNEIINFNPYYFNLENLKIIGNIHENSELLGDLYYEN